MPSLATAFFAASAACSDHLSAREFLPISVTLLSHLNFIQYKSVSESKKTRNRKYFLSPLIGNIFRGWQGQVRAPLSVATEQVWGWILEDATATDVVANTNYRWVGSAPRSGRPVACPA